MNANFREQFCSLFYIESLDKVIQTRVNAENEESSTILADFYSCSIDLIQHFLISKQFISTDRSKYLASVFARMQFVRANHIHLSYCYGTNTVEPASTSRSRDTYIDEQSGKFYILKKYENSELRYIDAMVEFIAEDEAIRAELSLHIKKLLQIYQKDGEQGFISFREKLTENYDPKWSISKEIKSDDPIPVLRQEKKPEITTEEIEQLMSQPTIRPTPLPKKITGEGNNDQLTSFPARASSSEIQIKYKKPSSNIPTQSKTNDSDEQESAPPAREENFQNHLKLQASREQQNDKRVTSKTTTTTDTDGETPNIYLLTITNR